jgi:cation:H+ antiporter
MACRPGLAQATRVSEGMEAGTVLLALAGLVLLGLGGDMMVRGAVGIAELLRVSPMFTGLVLVGFGTSTPELVTSLDAVFKGSPGIAVGNVLGSNIANTLLILGLTAVVLPIPADPRSFRRDAPMLAIATFACVGFALVGSMGRLVGLVFVLLLSAYLFFTYRMESRARDAPAELHALQGTLLRAPYRKAGTSVALAVAGLAGVLVGADLLVRSSIEIALAFGISDALIGLTIVAVGTSLPELATSMAAAFKRQTDIALGNIIGSNIFNILGILGVTALAAPFTIPRSLVVYDIWVLLGVTALLLVFALTTARITRGEGVIFLLLYFAYLGFLAARAMGWG